MNYANPFSLSSHTSFLSPKENPSILTSFLSQNQSIRSFQSIPTKLSFIYHQKNPKKTNYLSPRSKIVTLHEDRKLQNKNQERVKYVSEHSTTPYLYISKKHPKIRIPLLPKLSPEPKMEVQRMPYINIMTEPTAAIEEHSDEGRSNGEKSVDDKQLILNTSNNLLHATEITQNQEDQLSTSKLSLKSRFKLAVQKSFRNPPKKSLFNILISNEFNTFHEQERKSIQIKFEPGNQVLASKLTTLKKSNQRKQFIHTKEIQKQFRYINFEQFSVSTQAFQRKINIIHGTNSRNMIQSESFSLLPKSSRKSTSFISKQKNNIQLEIYDKRNEKNEESQLHQNQINITVTFENIEKTVYQFNKPKHIYQNNIAFNEEISELQNVTPKQTSKILPICLLSSNNHIQLVQTKKFDYNSSFINMKTKRQSIQLGVTQDEVQKLEQQNEFNKPGLYFRVYYQNKLYKLMQKSNYTKENLEEIEQSFRPNFVQPINNKIMNNAFTLMSTIEQGIRYRKITNESLADKIQFLGIKLSKYQIQSEKLIFDYNNETSQDKTESSDDSELEVSLNNFLDSPLNHNIRNIIKNKKPSKRKRSLFEISNEQNNQNYFFNDLPSNQKQLSTGTLVIINKIREAFHITLSIQPILNILESSAKNMLLSYSVSICDEFHMELRQDKDQIVNQKLQKFSKNLFMNSMIFQATEIRYSQILIGRYLCSTRMIDVEHQDPVVQTMNLEKQEKNDQQQSNQLQQRFSQIKSQKKISSKDSFNESNNKKPQTVIKMKQQSKRNLRKQDSVQVNQLKQLNRKAVQSGDFSNTLQKSNQQNSNFFTQTSTVLITKPTQISQQSVFRVMSSKHIDLNSSQQNISSSLSSSQNEETPQSVQVLNTPQTQQQQIFQASNQIYSSQNLHNLDEDSQQDLYVLYNSRHQIKNINCLSMYMNSLRMRTQIMESSRKQKLDQIQQIKLAIKDHKYTEFIDNIQFIPETQLETPIQNGNTFLILAAQCGCIEIVHELIKRGADINIQNDDGNTAVHLALAYGHYKIADLLIESGGSTHIINRKGQNAWGIL
ncbi:unnamed protein product [Paramecium pentaurelia]|uniref:Uncharacterized protein n=1 Tax=Paramecium pentaurelia TaxID=43138 RepID=A0A8S1V331_9CILI|nr:unnamed protein product [Paramecium pentaurelia]